MPCEKGANYMFERFMNRFASFEDEDYNDFDYDLHDEDDDASEEPEQPSRGRREQPRVVELKNQQSQQVIVLHPQSMEIAQDVANYVRSGRIVICNFEHVEQRIAQRVVDFMTGAAYTLDGRVHAVSDLIFLVTPRNITLTDAFEDEDTSMDLLRKAASGR